jgi:2-keto-myo-inositol isomerase
MTGSNGNNGKRISRRELLVSAGILTTIACANRSIEANQAKSADPDAGRFRYCLNTGTLRGHKLGLVKEIEVAAKAGYDGIEPWISSIEEYVKAGKSLGDLKKRIADLGLTVEGAIGFAEYLVDDDAQRAKGFERAKFDMDLVAKIGGARIAAPPSGANKQPGLDLGRAAERYRALLDLGDKMGVTPLLELWGASANLNRLSQCVYVALESGHPKACVLADVFHMYKGGSYFDGLKLLSAGALPVFHMNDYPADPPRDKINDSYRVFPGDGVAPLKQILSYLPVSGGTVLSLELFNQKYWQQDPLEIARTGLEKMKAAGKG